MAINKVVGSFDEAVADMQDGSLLHIGGFGGPAECPSYLVAAVARRGAKDLTITGNNPGFATSMLDMMKQRMSGMLRYPDDYHTPGLLIERGQVRKGVLAFPVMPGLAAPFEQLLKEGKVELELIGQGSLAERIRAARAGIAAFYTPVGYGTVFAEGRDIRWFDGKPCVLVTALKGDYSLIRAHKADRYGNLVYKGTARTFNATMAGASRVTIAEVDEIVELGELDPESIVTPGPYVQRVVVRPKEPQPAWEEPC
jgi:3-oxoacid CoA-transferase A subunit